MATRSSYIGAIVARLKFPASGRRIVPRYRREQQRGAFLRYKIVVQSEQSEKAEEP